MKSFKNEGRASFIFDVTIPAHLPLVKILLVKFILQHVWILIILQQNKTQKCEEIKDGGIYQNFWLILWSIFQLSSKTVSRCES